MRATCPICQRRRLEYVQRFDGRLIPQCAAGCPTVQVLRHLTEHPSEPGSFPVGDLQDDDGDGLGTLHLPAKARNSFPPPKGEIGNETNFRPKTAAEILRADPEPIVWVWEPFLPEGALALLAAFMKVGKSTFA